MLKTTGKPTHQYNDGVLTVCGVNAAGNRLASTKYAGIRFGKMTVGVTRFYEARLQGDEIDMLVRCPMLHGVHRGDVVIIARNGSGSNDQYQISQVQEDTDGFNEMRLSLVRIVALRLDERMGANG